MKLVPSSSSRFTVSNWRQAVVERRSPTELVVDDQAQLVEGARLLVADARRCRPWLARIEKVCRGPPGTARRVAARGDRYQADRRPRQLVEPVVVPGERGTGVAGDVPAQCRAARPVVLGPEVLAGRGILDPAVAPVEDAVDAQREAVADRQVDHALDAPLAVVADAQAQPVPRRCPPAGASRWRSRRRRCCGRTACPAGPSAPRCARCR